MKKNLTNLENLVGPENCARVARAIMREKLGQPEDLITISEGIQRLNSFVHQNFKNIGNETKIQNTIGLK